MDIGKDEKVLIPQMLASQWKMLQRGRNARYKSGRFRDSMLKNWSLDNSQVNVFYAIMNRKTKLELSYIKFAQDMMKACLTIK